ncbi:MAG: TetR/AcrR family transcriptional regulator [Spirochaetales bacterium]
MRVKTQGLSEKLIPVARQEFLEKGYIDSSLRTIAQNAGMTTGAIYRRYPDKEALFDALVADTENGFFELFTEAQNHFFDLIKTDKTNTSYNVTDNYLYVIVEYVYEHLEDFQLILCHSAGSKYEDFLHKLIELEISKKNDYYALLRQKGKIEGEIHPTVDHMLVTAYFTSLFEVVKHNMKKEEALLHIRQIATFFGSGFQSLVKFL